MISEIFQSEKGKVLGTKRTICEIHREIFDQVIIQFNDRPKALKKVVKLLEEAFVVGIKINAKLTEYKLKQPFGENNPKIKESREERKRLVEMLNDSKEFLKKYA